MCLGYYSKFSLEFLSEPPFRSYFQNSSKVKYRYFALQRPDFQKLRIELFAPRERHRTRMPPLGQKMRRWGQRSLAQGGNVGSLWPCGPLRSPRVLPPVLLVPLAPPACPPVLLVSLWIPPCVLRCPWCLLDPTVV